MTYKVTVRYRASNLVTKCELTIDADTPDDALQHASNLLFAGRRNRFPLSIDVQAIPSATLSPVTPAPTQPIAPETKAAARERTLLIASRTAVYYARELLSKPTSTTRTKFADAVEKLRAATNAYPPNRKETRQWHSQTS